MRGGLNLYAYVGGNPVERVDPLGLFYDPNYRPSPQPASQPEQLYWELFREVRLYKPGYAIMTGPGWQPAWTDYFDLLKELELIQLQYVVQHTPGMCALRHDSTLAPFSQELYERAEADLDFRSEVLNQLGPRRPELERHLRQEHENYRANGGRLSYDEWIEQGMPEAGKEKDMFSVLAQFRKDLGLPPAGSTGDKSTLAVMEVNGKRIFGINAHGQDVTGVNSISKTHAEIDVLNQIKQQGIDVRGKKFVMHVDRQPCRACSQNGGIRSMVRQLGITELTVIGPDGPIIITP